MRPKVKGKTEAKKTWKKQAQEENMNVSLSREDALCWSRWNVGATMMR